MTIGAIANADETVGAMDLRAFGTVRRTWFEQLRYEPLDYVVMGVAVLIFVLITALNIAGYGDFWLPSGWIS